MKKRHLCRVLTASLFLSVCLSSLSGCSGEEKSNNVPNSTVTTNNEPTTTSNPREHLGGIALEDTGLSVSYNDKDLIFPFDSAILASDWSLSLDRTYSNDVDANRDFSDAAIYVSDKYGLGSELVMATYKFSGESGVAGSQKALKEYGVYSMSLYYGGAEGTTKPNLKICGLNIFDTDASVLVNTLTSSSSPIESRSYSVDDAVTYSYVYDLGSYLMELKIVCRDQVVKQCCFTTTVSSSNN